MFFDPNRRGLFPPTQGGQEPPDPPPTDAPDQRRVTQGPPDPTPRIGGSTLAFDVTPLSTRSVNVPATDAAERLNAMLGSLIGKTIQDPKLLAECRQFFDFNSENAIIGAKTDVAYDEHAIGALIHEMGKDVARQNTIQPANNEAQSNADVAATEEEVDALVGKAIEPKVAEKYAARYPDPVIDGKGRKSFIFDGFGRVTEAARVVGLRRSEAEELAAAETKSLTRVNSPHPRDAPRIETEILFEVIVAIRKPGREEFSYLAERLQVLWLNGTGTTITLYHLNIAKRDVSNALSREQDQTKAASLCEFERDLLTLIGEARAMVAKLSSLPAASTNFSQYHDNAVARRFESELVMALIENPPRPVLEASKTFGLYLARYVIQLAARNPALLPRLAERLRGISSPYAQKLPHLRLFLEQPTPDNFKRMIREGESGYDILKQSLVCGQLKNAWEDVQKETLPYAEMGKDFAWNGIESSRHRTPSVSSGVAFVHPIFRQILRASARDEALEKLLERYAAGKTKTQLHIAALNEFIKEKKAGGEPLGPSDEALSAPGLSNAEREALKEKLARNQEEIVKRLKDLRNALMEDRKTFGRAVNRVQKEEALSKQDKKALYKLSERLEGALRAASQRLAESFLDDPRPLPLGFFPEESREEGPIAPELVETEISRKRFSSTPNDARFDNTRGVGFGTALPHQPKSDPGWDKWRLYPFEEHPDVVNPSLFEQSAFRSNRYVGRGASSSTFMMYNAFKQCNAESFYNINIGDAMVGTIMFMTFDSGHSMTDSMGGLTAYMDYEGEEDLRRGRDRLDEFYLQYGSIDMRMLRSHTETHKGVKQAIDAAFTRTLDWFEEIHNERVAQDRGAENDR